MKKFKIILKLVNYCNFTCNYCISRIPYLPKESYHNMSHKLMNLMVHYINKYLCNEYEIMYIVQGGEPTLHPYFNEIIDILSHTKHINKIRVLSNSYLDYKQIIKCKYPLQFGISVHYQQLCKHDLEKTFNTILNNIEYIVNTRHEQCSLNLLVDNTFPDKEQEYIIEKYISLIKKLNSVPDYHKDIIVPTEYYQIQNFDYSQLNNVYNVYGKSKIIYPYRVININPFLHYNYVCPLLNITKHTNVLLENTWREIAKNLDIGIKCTNANCACPTCLEV